MYYKKNYTKITSYGVYYIAYFKKISYRTIHIKNHILYLYVDIYRFSLMAKV